MKEHKPWPFWCEKERRWWRDCRECRWAWKVCNSRQQSAKAIADIRRTTPPILDLWGPPGLSPLYHGDRSRCSPSNTPSADSMVDRCRFAQERKNWTLVSSRIRREFFLSTYKKTSFTHVFIFIHGKFNRM